MAKKVSKAGSRSVASKIRAKRKREDKKRLGDRVDVLIEAVARARHLYELLVLRGFAEKTPGSTPSRLTSPDQQDIATYLFFEVAAQFERFCREAFLLEARIRLGVSSHQVNYVAAHPDRGIDGISGWATPDVLVKRANNLWGAAGAFAKMNSLLSTHQWQYLTAAHVLRNRIAHASGSEKYSKTLATLNVSKKSRKGTGPGRLLTAFPKSAASTDRWFHRFLDAYEAWAKLVRVNVR